MRALHRRAWKMALGISLSILTAMMTLGLWFLHHGTGGHIPPSRGLLAILLVVVIANALWSTSSTLLASINRHQRLAAWYLFETSSRWSALICSPGTWASTRRRRRCWSQSW